MKKGYKHLTVAIPLFKPAIILISHSLEFFTGMI